LNSSSYDDFEQVIIYVNWIRSNEQVLSGPFLVSRTGDAGWTERPCLGVQTLTYQDPTKGVNLLEQQEGGHGSRSPLRKV